MASPPAARAESKETDSKLCLGCHNQHPVNQILNSPHAQLADPETPFSQGGCQTCHGDATEHLKNPATHPPRTFGPGSSTPVEKQNAVCLDCHESDASSHWTGSTHETAGVACTNCHEAHAPLQKVKNREKQAQVCFNCHKITRAEMHRFSHHPVIEGEVTCADCHSPHGSFGDSLLKKATVNETCYTCHAEKRGPFLWEHAPVREDCTICHRPHGSTQDDLLAMRGPLLCQQCHSATFHPGTLYSGDDVQPLGADTHVIAQNCLNCHSKVHGSNHPTGVRFTR
ncbi:MAG: DmsE family decaheme c-type cytochrome [Alphaproteobacteria bacterium]